MAKRFRKLLSAVALFAVVSGIGTNAIIVDPDMKTGIAVNPGPNPLGANHQSMVAYDPDPWPPGVSKA